MKRFFYKLFLPAFLGVWVLAGVSTAFAQDSAPSATSPSEEKPAKDVKRDSPLKTIFDQSSAQVETVADSIEYQKDAKKVVARGNAVLTYQNMKLLADYAEVETDTKKSYAKGHVLIFKDGEPMLKGDEVYFDFENQSGSFPDARVVDGVWFARGKEVKQIKPGVIKVKKGGVTTCDKEDPHYEIRCTKATLYTGVKLRMYNATIYVLGKPVFWLPYLVIPLNWEMPFQVQTGYNSQDGAFIELSKGVVFNKHLSGKWHADWRSKRGFGGGWDQNYDFKKYAKGDIKLYWTQDRRAPTPGYVDDSGDLNPYAKLQKRDHGRGRITWRHRTDINEYTNIIMRYHRVADEYFLQDFFEDEYRSQMEPHSFVTATHNTERYGSMVHVTKRMNSFESIVERLPEVRLDWKNQPVPFLPDRLEDRIFNVSRLQFDNLQKKTSRSDSSQDVFRVDGYSRFIVPMKYKEIKLTPMIGYRGTEYSRDIFSTNPRYRQALEYSVDLRTHVYRVMDVSFEKLGIEVNQLRHVFEPSVRVQGVAASMTSHYKVPHCDTVDMIDSSSEVVFGVDNRLQTKRVIRGKTQRVDLVSLNTYVHYAFKPLDSTLSGGGFTILENELTLRPYEWLQFQHRMEVDLARNYIKLCNNDLVIRKGPWKFLFGHRYIHDQYDFFQDQSITGTQQFVVDCKYTINHLWNVGGYLRWDTAKGDLQEWQLSASRDLHDFVLDFGFNVRDSKISSHNQELFFRFRMKSFPSLQGGLGGSRTSFSEPRIGEAVAGANQDWGRHSLPADGQPYGL